ncbi:hypothetical protein N9L94_06145 [Robiginitalea sp.]|nr:hypothetical protein [Robiginitalea sp.]
MNIKLKEVNVMAENRGRPSEKPAVALDKWVLETEDQIWHFDRSKSTNGCWKVETKYKAGEKQSKPKIDQRMYHKNMPTVVVFKTSNRSNAKTKMKVINKNIDYVLSAKKIPGIPDIAEWLEIGVGTSFISKYTKKYNLS